MTSRLPCAGWPAGGAHSPERPTQSDSNTSSRPQPAGETRPIPVMTTSGRVGLFTLGLLTLGLLVLGLLTLGLLVLGLLVLGSLMLGSLMLGGPGRARRCAAGA